MFPSRHFRISPLALFAIVAVGSVIGCAQAGYFKDAFHEDILARVNPADVLTPADMVPAAGAAGRVATPAAQSSSLTASN